MFEDISKVLFLSDMDGTLLSADKTISKRNEEAMLRFKAAGGKFAVATGRVIQATRHYFTKIGLDSVILCNGGMVYDCRRGEIIWAKFLPEDKARRMISALLEKFPEAAAEISTPERIYAVNMNDCERHHMKIAGFTADPVDSLDEVPDGSWCKVLFAMENRFIEPFAAYAQTLPDCGDVEYVTSSTIFHEMLPKNCSKGDALRELVKAGGFEGYTTVAMGDFNNDITMLEAADFSAAPSNAIDDVKAVCDMVCKSDCTQGAVAEVIDHIFDLHNGNK